MAITPLSPRKGDSLSAWILRANLVMQELLCFGVQGAIVPTKKYKKASIYSFTSFSTLVFGLRVFNFLNRCTASEFTVRRTMKIRFLQGAIYEFRLVIT